jgi:hypothetical protein
MKNPFTTNPVDTSETFIGRKEELDLLLECIFNRKGLSLRGERRTGKTSLLKYVAKQFNFPKNYIVVYITLEKYADARINELWNKLYNEIDKKLKEKLSGLIIENTEVKSYIDFSDYLEKLNDNSILVILLIDEFDKLENYKDFSSQKTIFFSQLRALPHNIDNLTYIIATRKGIRHLEVEVDREDKIDTDKYASPFFNIFISWNLQPFSEVEARELISRYCENQISKFMLKDIQFFDEQTGFFPFFFQLLCDCWISVYHNSDSDKSNDQAGELFHEKVIRLYYKKCEEGFFKYYWDHSTPEEKKVLMYLSDKIDRNIKKDIPNDEEDLFLGTINQLQDRCLLISRDNQNYHFFSPKFKEICNTKRKIENEKRKIESQKQELIARQNFKKNLVKRSLLSIIVISLVMIITGFFLKELRIYQKEQQKNFQSAIYQAEKTRNDNHKSYLYLLEALKLNSKHHDTITMLQEISSHRFTVDFSDIQIHEENSLFRFYYKNDSGFYQKDIHYNSTERNYIAYDEQKLSASVKKLSNIVFHISHNGRWLTYSQNKTIIIYDLHKQTIIFSHTFTTPIKQIRFNSNDSMLIIVNSDNHPLHTLALNDFSMINHSFEGTINKIEIYNFQHIIIASMLKLYLYQISEMTSRRIYESRDFVADIACALDKQLIACGFTDGGITLLKLTDQTLSKTVALSRHQDTITDMAFSDDNHWLVSASIDQKLLLWDVTQVNQKPFVLSNHAPLVIRVAVSKDWAISAGPGDGIRFWPIQTKLIIRQSCQYLREHFFNKNHFLSKEEWQTTFDLPYEKTCSEE